MITPYPSEELWDDSVTQKIITITIYQAISKQIQIKKEYAVAFKNAKESGSCQSPTCGLMLRLFRAELKTNATNEPSSSTSTSHSVTRYTLKTLLRMDEERPNNERLYAIHDEAEYVEAMNSDKPYTTGLFELIGCFFNKIMRKTHITLKCPVGFIEHDIYIFIHRYFELGISEHELGSAQKHISMYNDINNGDGTDFCYLVSEKQFNKLKDHVQVVRVKVCTK